MNPIGLANSSGKLFVLSASEFNVYDGHRHHLIKFNAKANIEECVRYILTDYSEYMNNRGGKIVITDGQNDITLFENGELTKHYQIGKTDDMVCGVSTSKINVIHGKATSNGLALENLTFVFTVESFNPTQTSSDKEDPTKVVDENDRTLSRKVYPLNVYTEDAKNPGHWAQSQFRQAMTIDNGLGLLYEIKYCIRGDEGDIVDDRIVLITTVDELEALEKDVITFWETYVAPALKKG